MSKSQNNVQIVDKNNNIIKKLKTAEENRFCLNKNDEVEDKLKKSDQNGNSDLNKDNSKTKATNITYQKSKVLKAERLKTFGSKSQSGCTIWFTGLSCSGKTTISFALEEYLTKVKKVTAYCLDGDNIRCGLNSNLGFSKDDRAENIRRIGEVSKLFNECGIVCLTAFISPYNLDRKLVRESHEKAGLNFIEVFVNTPLEICEQRDVRGLYKKARLGEIKDFTGVQTVYEEPINPEITLSTCEYSIEESVNQIINYLDKHGIIKGLNSEINLIHDLDQIEMLSRELFVKQEEALSDIKKKAATLPRLNINKIELQWIQVLSEGWAFPLTGFMREDEYLQCLHFNSLKINNEIYNQSIPIVLSCTTSERQILAEKDCICLIYEDKEIALLKNISFYPHRKEERCARQFGLSHKSHPYQKFIYEECGDWLIGGDLEVFQRIKWNDGLDQYRLTPYELKEKFKEMKADAVFAFQLRNPIHNGHALLMKDTRKYLLDKGFKNPVLLLHPLGGWTKDDDAPLDVRIEQHKAVLEDGQFLDADSTIMAIFPSPMMYAGPTEVQWHAKSRMNAGAQFYIVGRDPAGMPHPDTKEDIYDPTHGSRVLQMAPGLTHLQIVPFKVAAYNKNLKKMDYFDPKQIDSFEFISGTKMRKLAREGQQPPDGFMVNKAWNILANYYKNLNNS